MVSAQLASRLLVGLRVLMMSFVDCCTFDKLFKLPVELLAELVLSTLDKCFVGNFCAACFSMSSIKHLTDTRES